MVPRGWRVAFGNGGLLGLGVMLVRRNVPDSARWLFIHGWEKEAEKIVDRIESEMPAQEGIELPPTSRYLAGRQQASIPFREIARVAAQRYPRRTLLGLALSLGQAFLYNAVSFDLGTIVSGYFAVAPGAMPRCIFLFAIGNFSVRCCSGDCSGACTPPARAGR
ncbi:MFS transporter [Streptomyces sp. NPDC001507]|uniref:MFS transporter n=1 Tax=Streptomyces sp. NPDC001507 TaxID=3364579 RepID=UPI003683C846